MQEMDAYERPERTTLLESDLPKLVCAGQLSRKTRFTLRVDGPFGAREGEALMTILKAQVSLLAEE